MKFLFSLLGILLTFSGKAYWQQYTQTRIVVTLDDKKHFLHGWAMLNYFNNSPDTLSFIYLHLYPNAYKNDKTQFCEQQILNGKTDFYFAPERDRGYIDSLQFLIDGVPQDYNVVDGNIDIVKVDFPKPLLPGQSVQIETPFRVKIPKVFSRLGHNKQAYFISQWFPKPAVYDANGWHPMPYLDQGEFYSEFGSFDVTVTLPKNYVVMATGNCQTASEQTWMDSIARLPMPVDTLYSKSFPISSQEYKTIRFTEDSVHDFAWFADKRWILRQAELTNNSNGNLIRAYVAFLPNHQKEWQKATDILQTTLQAYGSKVGLYPYKTIKAVEGEMFAGGGMEYPTVTIIDQSSVRLLEKVLIHEAGHNWFYGILGSNERVNPWMDEGLNTFFEQKTVTFLHDNKPWNAIDEFENLLYYHNAKQGNDQRLTGTSTSFRPLNYGIDVYQKTALMLRWLEDYMGQMDFENGMKSYFEQWKFKHPCPLDFQISMQNATSKSLDWFFDFAIHTSNEIDFKVKSVHQKGRQVSINLKNKSGFAAPVLIAVKNKDSLLQAKWTVPFDNKLNVFFDSVDTWTQISLSDNYLESNILNNDFRRKGLFHKWDPKVGVGYGIGRTKMHNLFLLPFLSFNQYDGVGLGLALHNLGLPQSNFQFALAPQYSTGSKAFAGVAALAYSWYPRNVFQEIRLQTNLKSFSKGKSDLNLNDPIFAQYFKIAPFIQFVFKEKTPQSTLKEKLVLKYYSISEEAFKFKQNFAIDSLYRPSIVSQVNTYATIRFDITNSRTFHPYSITLNNQFGKGFIKPSIDAQLRIDYDIKDKSFYIRSYFGGFIQTNSGLNLSRYYLNSTYTSQNDYLYEDLFLGRNQNSGFYSRQISMQEGSFKLPTNLFINPIGRTNQWLFALNLKTDLPFGKLPLRLYTDIGTFAKAKSLNASGAAFIMNTGFELSLFRNLLNIYFPVLSSNDFGNYTKSIFAQDRFLNSITFSFNIQNSNGLKATSIFLNELTH